MNQRDDEWGGSAEKRRRFALEVIRRVRERVSAAFVVGVKLNSSDHQRGGFSEEESMALVEALDRERLDFIEISGGCYESAAMMKPPPARASSAAREAFFMEFATKVRNKTRIPLMLTGGFRTAHGMNLALESGSVDLIGIARPLCLEV